MSGPSVPRAVALLGDPVDHSLSPVIHAAAFDALGLEARYVAVRTLDPELPHLLRAFARSGGGNVTVPHKLTARKALDRATAAARATGACNCFWASDDGSLVGDNTDVGGFLAAVRSWREAPELSGARILLLGAGGAARAVAAACVEAGAGHIEVRNRTVARARELVRRFEGKGPKMSAGPLSSDRAGTDVLRFDLVVNATSLGLEDQDPLPLDLRRMEVGAVFDLVYGEAGTRWTRHAADIGIPAVDGLDMLVRQAGLSLQRWFQADPPLEEMRQAAEDQLRR